MFVWLINGRCLVFMAKQALENRFSWTPLQGFRHLLFKAHDLRIASHVSHIKRPRRNGAGNSHERRSR